MNVDPKQLVQEITEAAILRDDLPSSYKQNLTVKADALMKYIDELAKYEEKARSKPLPDDEDETV